MLDASKDAAKRWALAIGGCILILPLTAGIGKIQRHFEEKREAAQAVQDAKDRKVAEAKELADLDANLARAREETAARRRGDQCVSQYDGSVPSVEEAVKRRLRDPSSFEHVSTLVSGADHGKHAVVMTYRAKNGFGGLNTGMVEASVDGETCSAVLTGTMG